MAEKDELGEPVKSARRGISKRIGYTVLDRNWRCGRARSTSSRPMALALVVVEVKTRRSDGFGHPFEAIDARKRRGCGGSRIAWIAEHRERVQGRRLRLDADRADGADPATARSSILDLELS